MADIAWKFISVSSVISHKDGTLSITMDRVHSAFETDYKELIQHIKQTKQECEITFSGLKTKSNDDSGDTTAASSSWRAIQPPSPSPPPCIKGEGLERPKDR